MSIGQLKKNAQKKDLSPNLKSFFYGAGGIRTHDLRVANAALSQLSYNPERSALYSKCTPNASTFYLSPSFLMKEGISIGRSPSVRISLVLNSGAGRVICLCT